MATAEEAGWGREDELYRLPPDWETPFGMLCHDPVSNIHEKIPISKGNIIGDAGAALTALDAWSKLQGAFMAAGEGADHRGASKLRVIHFGDDGRSLKVVMVWSTASLVPGKGRLDMERLPPWAALERKIGQPMIFKNGVGLSAGVAFCHVEGDETSIQGRHLKALHGKLFQVLYTVKDGVEDDNAVVDKGCLSLTDVSESLPLIPALLERYHRFGVTKVDFMHAQNAMAKFLDEEARNAMVSDSKLLLSEHLSAVDVNGIVTKDFEGAKVSIFSAPLSKTKFFPLTFSSSMGILTLEATMNSALDIFSWSMAGEPHCTETEPWPQVVRDSAYKTLPLSMLLLMTRSNAVPR